MRLTGDPAGDAPHERVGDREETERRPAEVKPVTECLTLTHDDVDALRTRGLQQTERDRVRGADRKRADLMRRLRNRRQALHRSEEVRLRDDHRADVVRERRQLRHSVHQPDDLHLHLPAPRERLERLDRVRVHAGRDDEPTPPVLKLRDIARRRNRARALVHRRVGDRKPSQLADRGLVLEHRLQPALGDLRLIRRVWREEL